MALSSAVTVKSRLAAKVQAGTSQQQRGKAMRQNNSAKNPLNIRGMSVLLFHAGITRTHKGGDDDLTCKLLEKRAIS